MSVSVLLDIFFVSTVPISLQLGTRGLAYSSIASQGSVLIFTLIVCWRMLGIRTHDLVSIDKSAMFYIRNLDKLNPPSVNLIYEMLSFVLLKNKLIAFIYRPTIQNGISDGYGNGPWSEYFQRRNLQHATSSIFLSS